MEVNGAHQLLGYPHSSEYIMFGRRKQFIQVWWGWVNDNFHFGGELANTHKYSPRWIHLEQSLGLYQQDRVGCLKYENIHEKKESSTLNQYVYILV